METQEFGSEAVKEGTSGDTVVTWEDEGPLTDVTVIVPKNVPLGKDTKAAGYEVTVKGNIRYDEKVTVAPEDDITELDGVNFYMKQASAIARAVRPDVPATVVQDATEWTPDEVTADGTAKAGTISAPGLSFGSWEGNMTFNVGIEAYDGECVHDFIDNPSGGKTCLKCGIIYVSTGSEDVFGPPAGHEHAYSEEITKAATCTEAGSKTLTCTCGDTKTEVIPAGHNYVGGECTKCHTSEELADWRYRISQDNSCIYLSEFINKEATDVTVHDSYKVNGVSYPVVLDYRSTSTNNGFKTYNYELFRNNKKIKSVAFGDNVTMKVPSLDELFYGCSSLKEINFGGLAKLNLSGMHWTFYNCSSLTNLDLSSLNTENMQNTASAFSGCSSLTNLNLSNFSTSMVKDMSGMFAGCSSLANLNVNSFNTNNVINMSGMFASCSSLTNLDLGNFDTGNVINMRSMFSDCKGLTSLDLSNFSTSKVEEMDFMFYNCSSLINLDLKSFDTSNVTFMTNMFYGVSSLKVFDLRSFDTRKVTGTSFMFADTNATRVDVTTGKWTLNASDIQLSDGVLQYH